MKNVILVMSYLVSLTLFAAWEDVTPEKYPNADQVVLNELIHYEYNPDGSYSSRDEQWFKILTEKGRRESSTISIGYNLRYGKGEITFIEVIGEDGIARNIDIASTLNETTDNSSMGSNIFDPMSKNLSCAIPALKVGDIVHFIIKKKIEKARFQNQWGEIEIFEYTYPIEHMEVTIKAPAERPLLSRSIRNPLGNVTESAETLEDGSTLHKWVVENSPQAFEEDDMPPMYTQIQHLRVSTATDWRDLSKWYWNLCLPHLNCTTEAITNKVEEIGHDYTKLYKWVAQEIRYMGLTMEDTSPGYSPHDVNVTFDNRYGVCRDKAGLLVAMLRIAGYDAFPVLINHGAKLDKEVPQPFFNHAIVAIDLNGEYVLMDPTDESSRDLFPSYLSNSSYLVCRPEGETLQITPTISAKENSLIVNSDGKMESDGSILLKSEIIAHGINDNALRGRLLRMKARDHRKLIENVMRRIAPGSEVLSVEITPADLRNTEEPLTFKVLAHLPDMMTKGENISTLTLPMLSKNLGVVNWLAEGKTSLDKRRFPLQLAATAGAEETLTLELCENLGEVIKLPEPMKLEGAVSYIGEVNVDSSVLSARRVFNLERIEYSSDEYLGLKAAFEKIEAAERVESVFAASSIKGADVHYRLNEIEVAKKDEYNWVVTNTFEKEILTYDGKKKSSEIIIDYNPSWETIELANAKVTNKNGSVSVVTEKEINEMDAEWTGEAPRYPASKQFIVNLPSVEIGSVISCKIVRTIKASPLPFFARYYFDTVEPTDKLIVKVDDFVREVASPKLIVRESMQPNGGLWRENLIMSDSEIKGGFDLKVKSYSFPEAGDSLKEIRDWMAKNIRVVGPSLYETRLIDQMTSPKTVLEERYASRLDYARTMCAVMKGAGYEAEVVFASLDKLDSEKERLEALAFGNREKYSNPLVKVGNIFIGTENEYTPLGLSVYNGSTYFNPESGEIGTIISKSAKMPTDIVTRVDMKVNEDGGVDFEFEKSYSGVEIGAFRKRYAEMLEEDRSRHFLELVSAFSTNAKATSELETDIESYPSTIKFKAHADDFAVVNGDMITLEIPDFAKALFPLTGTKRLTPIGIAAKDSTSISMVALSFPKGFTEVEHVSEEYVMRDPTGPEIWHRFKVETKVEDEVLTLLLTRISYEHGAALLDKSYFPLLKEWSKVAGSKANRTIMIRRK